MEKTLIIQGGGFRTGFSTGVMDAFITANHYDFDSYIGVSGGTIALSYYLSEQYKQSFEAMCYLASHNEFVSYLRLISPIGLMNVDLFHEVATNRFPFDFKTAMKNVKGKELAFVMTDLESGMAHYYHPNKKTWVDGVIASCTMPFVTKGKHTLHNRAYMDGGWSDPLPIKWAYEHGARDVVFIRTVPSSVKIGQSWSDYFGTFVHRSNPNLLACFEKNHEVYNEAIDFMENPPADLKIIQIAPEYPLKAGTHTNSIPAITEDYRHGLDKGIEFLQSIS